MRNGAGKIGPFETVRVGGVKASRAFDRGFEMVKAAFLHQCGDSSAPKPEVRVASWTMTQRPVFFTRGLDRLDVERQQRTQIDDFGVDARRPRPPWLSATWTIVP